MDQFINSQTPLIVTGDEFKSSRLERMLSKFSASYKLYFFKSILSELYEGNKKISFRRLACRMIAAAWYPVKYFHLNLGSSDKLGRCVEYATNVCNLRIDSSEDEIIDALEKATDSELNRKISDLTRYVPFRLIRPFYEDGLNLLRDGNKAVNDRWVNDAIAHLNRENIAGAPYQFNCEVNAISVDDDWARYFLENKTIIEGWLDMKLVSYLQARNPSVPAVSSKIKPPIARNLTSSTNYWRDAIQQQDVVDIYTGSKFEDSSYIQYGSLSIDHFIPWSFVLHDEPWNLTPAFKNVNSSKSDKLPVFDTYFESFAGQQFEAIMSLKDSGRHAKIFESYLNIDSNVYSYELSDRSRESFEACLKKVILPLYQIALNQGYSEWHYIKF